MPQAALYRVEPDTDLVSFDNYSQVASILGAKFIHLMLT